MWLRKVACVWSLISFPDRTETTCLCCHPHNAPPARLPLLPRKSFSTHQHSHLTLMAPSAALPRLNLNWCWDISYGGGVQSWVFFYRFPGHLCRHSRHTEVDCPVSWQLSLGGRRGKGQGPTQRKNTLNQNSIYSYDRLSQDLHVSVMSLWDTFWFSKASHPELLQLNLARFNVNIHLFCQAKAAIEKSISFPK